MEMIKSLFLAALVGVILFSCSSRDDWRTASIAPDPAETGDAVLQVYGADAWEWRGWFAIHTWIAKQVPQLNLKMPFSAIGSGYVGQAD